MRRESKETVFGFGANGLGFRVILIQGYTDSDCGFWGLVIRRLGFCLRGATAGLL